MTASFDCSSLRGLQPETLRIWSDLPRRRPEGLRLPVRSGIEITEIQELDLGAYLEHFREPDIHDWTLRIPHPYCLSDAREWYERVRLERESGSHSMQLAIRTD